MRTILVVGSDAAALVKHLQAWSYPALAVVSGAAALDAARTDPPILLIAEEALADGDGQRLCHQIKAETAPHACYTLLLVPHADMPEPDAYREGIDDWLGQPFSPAELQARVQVGLRVAELQQEQHDLAGVLAQKEAEIQQFRDRTEEMTHQLIEMSAQLQVRLVQDAAQEAQHVHAVQADAIVQAVVTLRHEINNPLFAITGSAETALKRLRNLGAQGVPGAQEAIVSIERVLKGAERIQQVIQAFSDTEIPVTTEYLPGIPMLELSSQPTPTPGKREEIRDNNTFAKSDEGTEMSPDL